MTWFRDCHGFDSVKSLASPYGIRNKAGLKSPVGPFGAKRPAGQPRHQSRKRQSSNAFRALETGRRAVSRGGLLEAARSGPNIPHAVRPALSMRPDCSVPGLVRALKTCLIYCLGKVNTM